MILAATDPQTGKVELVRPPQGVSIGDCVSVEGIQEELCKILFIFNI